MMIENLETRQMLSITLTNAVLTVEGTDYSDVIIVNQKNTKTFEIFENGSCTVICSTRIVTAVVLKGCDGYDYLALTQCVKAKGYLYGGDDCDTLVGGRAGDYFDGGYDDDTVDYSWRRECLTLVINGQPISGAPGEHDEIECSIENIIGGCGDDLIVGDDDCNELYGGKGDDCIFGEYGDDLIDGGCDDDSLEGGSGDDIVIGGYGYDTMFGGRGCDTFFAVDGCRDIVNGEDDWDEAFVDCEDNFVCIEKVYFQS